MHIQALLKWFYLGWSLQIEHKYFPVFAKTSEIEALSEWDDKGEEVVTGSGNSPAILDIAGFKLPVKVLRSCVLTPVEN
jgi:hypothetical protein